MGKMSIEEIKRNIDKIFQIITKDDYSYVGYISDITEIDFIFNGTVNIPNETEARHPRNKKILFTDVKSMMTTTKHF